MIAKCSCQNCGDHLEFDSDGTGLTVDCPHCGMKTQLYIPKANLADSLRTKIFCVKKAIRLATKPIVRSALARKHPLAVRVAVILALGILALYYEQCEFYLTPFKKSEHFFELMIQNRESEARTWISDQSTNIDLYKFFDYHYSAFKYLDKYKKDGITIYVFQLRHGICETPWSIGWQNNRIVYLETTE